MKPELPTLLIAHGNQSYAKQLAHTVNASLGWKPHVFGAYESLLTALHQSAPSCDVVLIDYDLLLDEKATGKSPSLLLEKLEEVRPNTAIVLLESAGCKLPLTALEGKYFKIIPNDSSPDALSRAIIRAAEYSRLLRGSYQSQLFSDLISTSNVLFQEDDLEIILRAIVDAIADIGFDRVRLFLPSDDGVELICQATNLVDDRFVGQRLPIALSEEFHEKCQTSTGYLFFRPENVDLPKHPVLDEGMVSEWVTLYLVEGKRIGKLSVDNLLTGRPILPEAIEPLRLFASQAAIALQKQQLMRERIAAFRSADWKAGMLSVLHKSAARLSTINNSQTMFTEALTDVVNILDNVEHGSMVLLDEGGEFGRAVAEYPPSLNLVGTVVPVTGYLAEEVVFIEGRSYITYDAQNDKALGPVREVFRKSGIQSVFLVPMVYQNKVIGSFGFDSLTYKREFSHDEIEVCEVFASLVAAAISNSNALENMHDNASMLAMLHEIGDLVEAETDVGKILHLVLTGVTAGYCLQFNRAALLLCEPNYPGREQLVGQLGIGHIRRKNAEAAWDAMEEASEDQLAAYLASLQDGATGTTPVGDRIKGLKIKIGDSGRDIFSEIMSQNEQQCFILDEGQIKRLPSSFQKAFRPSPTAPMAIVQIRSNQEILGLLVVDNKFNNRKIDEWTIRALKTFTNSAANALVKARLLAQVSKDRERLLQLLSLSKRLQENIDVTFLLDEIVEQMRVATGADGVVMAMIDVDEVKMEQVRSAGKDKDFRDLEMFFRPDGNSIRVMRTGEPILIEDVLLHPDVNENVLERGYRSAVGLPLTLGNEPFGVVWIHYEDARKFVSDEVVSWQLFANQLAVAYENSRRFREINLVKNAMEAINGTMRPNEVLRKIVYEACNALSASSASLWSFDQNSGRFDQVESASYGVKRSLWTKFFPNRQPLDEVTRKVTQSDEGWYVVNDVADPKHDRIFCPSLRAFYKAAGIKSYLGLPLFSEEQLLGILYINYDTDRWFSDHEIEITGKLAQYAAVAIGRSRQIDLLNRTRDSMRELLNVSVLENKVETLQSIVTTASHMLRADAVTIFSFDNERQRFGLSGHKGVRNHRAIENTGNLNDHPILRSVLFGFGPYYVDRDAQLDPLVRGRFTDEEEVVSVAAMPLEVEGKKVGVMFVSYREEHKFTQDDRIALELFASHAAISVENAQLFEQEQQNVIISEALNGTNDALDHESLGLDELMQGFIARIWHILEATGSPPVLADILLREGDQLILKGAVDKFDAKHERGRDSIDLLDKCQPGIIGRAFNTAQSQIVPDVSSDNDYLICHELVGSELAVPILLRGQAIGVINIEHLDKHAFIQKDLHLLENFAERIANAIERYYRRRRETALHQASRAIAEEPSSSAKTLLERILAKALAHIGDIGLPSGCEVSWGGIQLARGSNEMILTAVYPHEWYEMLRDYHVQALVVNKKPNGIAARAILEQTEMFVADVRNDPHYACYDARTLSEIDIPLTDKYGKVLGVLGLESPQLSAFDDEDARWLRSLSELVVIALERHQMTEMLAESGKRVESATALAQVSMISTNWHHATVGHAQTIEELAMLIHNGLDKGENRKTREYVERIMRLSSLIKGRKLTYQLSAFSGVTSVEINEVIRGRIDQIVQNQRYEKINVSYEFYASEGSTVRANADWLRNLFDILVDNAFTAMKESEVAELKVVTREHEGEVEIRFCDTGCGIPEAIRERLLNIPIEKPRSSRGSGIGLLMAQLIVKTYEGEIGFADNFPQGTIFTVRLPVEPILKLVRNQVALLP